MGEDDGATKFAYPGVGVVELEDDFFLGISARRPISNQMPISVRQPIAKRFFLLIGAPHPGHAVDLELISLPHSLH